MSYDPAGGQPPGGQGWQGGGGQPPYPPPGGGYGGGGQPPSWGGPPGGPGGPGSGSFGGGPAGQKSAFAALFDFSFNSFATPGLIKLLYVVGAVLLVLGWLGFTIVNFAVSGPVAGIGTLVLGAIGVLFYLAFLRVLLEFYYAVVRMSEDIHNRR